MAFPATPTDGQTYAAPSGVTYTYHAAKGVWGISTSVGASSTKVTVPYGTAGGTATAITSTLAPAYSSPAAGDLIEIKMTAAATGATTLNPSATGAKDVKKQDGSAITSGYWGASDLVQFAFDGTNWVVSSITSGASSGSPIPTSSTLPVGWSGSMYNTYFGVSNGATIDGSRLQPFAYVGPQSYSTAGPTGFATQTGTWMNITGSMVGQNSNGDGTGTLVGLFVRTL